MNNPKGGKEEGCCQLPAADGYRWGWLLRPCCAVWNRLACCCLSTWRISHALLHRPGPQLRVRRPGSRLVSCCAQARSVVAELSRLTTAIFCFALARQALDAVTTHERALKVFPTVQLIWR